MPEFRGDPREYFRIWIVNLALTVVTLGIYGPWAKVRKLRWFHGNTVLADSAFGYHGEPLKILKGRAIAVVLLVAYFLAGAVTPVAGVIVLVLVLLALPWLTVKSRLFQLRMTSWRGLRFDFVPDYAGAYRAILGWGAAAVVTLGLLTPLFLRARYRFVVSRTRFGGHQFTCEPCIKRFFKTSFVAVGLAMLVTAPVVALFGVLAAAVGLGGEGATVNAGTLQGLALVPAVLLLVPVVWGYTTARNLNAVFGKSTLGPVAFRSELRARRLMWIHLTNILGIVFTLGLYTPWAQVRLARYRVESLALLASRPVDEFVAEARARDPNAAGEEISEVFDVDFGL